VYNVLQTVRLLLAFFLACLIATLLEMGGIVRFGNAENALLAALICWLFGFLLRRVSRHYAEWSPKASGKTHALIGASLAIAFMVTEHMAANAVDDCSYVTAEVAETVILASVERTGREMRKQVGFPTAKAVQLSRCVWAVEVEFLLNFDHIRATYVFKLEDGKWTYRSPTATFSSERR
jgi:hypothetical protein